MIIGTLSRMGGKESSKVQMRTGFYILQTINVHVCHTAISQMFIHMPGAPTRAFYPGSLVGGPQAIYYIIDMLTMGLETQPLPVIGCDVTLAVLVLTVPYHQ